MVGPLQCSESWLSVWLGQLGIVRRLQILQTARVGDKFTNRSAHDDNNNNKVNK